VSATSKHNAHRQRLSRTSRPSDYRRRLGEVAGLGRPASSDLDAESADSGANSSDDESDTPERGSASEVVWVRETGIDPEELDRPEWNSLVKNYDKHDIGEAYFTGRMHQIGLEVEHWGIDKRHHDDGLIFDNKMDLRLWEPMGERKRPEKWPSDVEGTPYDDYNHHEYREVCVDGDPELGWAALNAGVEPEESRVSTDEWKLRGIVDVKTKSSTDWMGKFNLRHLSHYAEHAAFYEEYGVPTFLYFTMVDVEEETVGEENLLVPIPTDWEWEPLVDHYDPNQDFSLSYGECKDSLSYGECKDTARTCPIVKRTFRAPDGNLVVTTDEDYHDNFDYFVSEVL